MKRKSLLALLLALTMCLSCLAACGGTDNGNQNGGAAQNNGSQNNDAQDDGAQDTQEPPADQGGEEAASQIHMDIPEGTGLGDRIADFTFTTYDGQEYGLYDTLAEKKMVLINIWATWCGPCQAEFPYMEAAYEAYQDDIEIFALSCEETDDDSVLSEYVSDMGMTFPVGRDTPDLSTAFEVTGIPTSIVVDRFGVICFIESGSQTSEDNFRRLFDPFVADAYAESVVLEEIPAPVCDVEPSSEADLAAALNAEGGSLAFVNPAPQTDWPFLAATDGDRSCAVSSNEGLDKTASVVSFSVEAQEGDALALDYKVSTEAGFDLLSVYVDGGLVKVFSGVCDWSAYAAALTPGSHEVLLAYEKDDYTGDNEDKVWIDNVRILSGAEAADALAAMPVFPTADETAILPAGEDAKEIIFDDQTGSLAGSFGDARYYIIPGDEAAFRITLAAGIDPDGATMTSYYDNSSACLSQLLDGDHYTFTSGIDSVETTGYDYCYVLLSAGELQQYALFFASEENVNHFIYENFTDTDGTVYASWTYADGTAPGTDALPEGTDDAPEGYSDYTLTFTDQNGDPVEGVIANICDDNACTPMTSDADGLIQFTYPSFAYHIQVIRVPEGYEYDTTQESYLAEEGGVTEFVITKN